MSFAGSNDDLAGIEIDILDTQVRTFEEPQACTVEKRGHELRRTVELGEERSDFANVHHYGECLRPFRADQVVGMTFVVEEDESHDPRPIGLPGTRAEMAKSDRARNPVAKR